MDGYQISNDIKYMKNIEVTVNIAINGWKSELCLLVCKYSLIARHFTG